MTAEDEDKVVYDEDGAGHIRVLRGHVDDPGPEYSFIRIRRFDKDILLRKIDILRIETTHGSLGGRPARAGEPKPPLREVLERTETEHRVGDLTIAL